MCQAFLITDTLYFLTVFLEQGLLLTSLSSSLHLRGPLILQQVLLLPRASASRHIPRSQPARRSTVLAKPVQDVSQFRLEAESVSLQYASSALFPCSDSVNWPDSEFLTASFLHFSESSIFSYVLRSFPDSRVFF